MDFKRLAALLAVEIPLVTLPLVAPSIPLWAAVLSWVIAALLGVYAASGWLKRHVWWRFRLKAPSSGLNLAAHAPDGQDEMSRAAAARAAYEMRKLTGGIGDPVAMGARLLEEDAHKEELARQRAVVRAKAQMMLDRLATRNHSMMEAGKSPKHDSYLAAMWDAEQRGEMLDNFHRWTFEPASHPTPPKKDSSNGE